MALLIVSAAIAALTLLGCKPTEANYRKAYDAAVAKREKATEELMLPKTGMLSVDGPQLRVVEGDSIFVDHRILRLEDGSRLPGRWAMAVGKYRMDTNAKAGAESLKGKGWPKAVMAKVPGGYYFTIATTVSTIDSANYLTKRFAEEFPEYPYVGLPGKPVFISF